MDFVMIFIWNKFYGADNESRWSFYRQESHKDGEIIGNLSRIYTYIYTYILMPVRVSIVMITGRKFDALLSRGA